MISESNYYETIRQHDTSQWPDDLKRGHSMVDALTLQGKNWSSAKNNPTIHKTLQMYFEQLDKFLLGKRKELPEKPSFSVPKPEAPAPIQTKPKEAAVPRKEAAKKPDQGKGDGGNRNQPKAKNEDESEYVELVSDEIKLLKRFYNMVGKTRTREQILGYIKAVQKSIAERRIRKTSPHAESFREIQSMLVDFYNNTKRQSLEVEASAKLLKHLEATVNSQALFPSISFIKRFISLHGKEDMEDKAEKLLESLTKSLESGRISARDKYYKIVQDIAKRIEQYLKRPSKRMEIPASELNGLQGIVEGCNCDDELKGIDESDGWNTGADEPEIVNSLEFVKQEFKTIGLRGKWFDFMGDPSPGFTAMVFGRPKMGKSYLCIDFAGYLAKYHGRVLYVAKEEKLHDTLKRKLVEMRVPHQNLDVVAGLPSNLEPYDYIFLDSVNKLGLKPSQLEEVESAYPDKSFVYIFQTVKTGSFRGDNSFQHHVDVVIEVPTKGKAVQYGRFNQGGEMDIFSKMAA